MLETLKSLFKSVEFSSEEKEKITIVQTKPVKTERLVINKGRVTGMSDYRGLIEGR